MASKWNKSTPLLSKDWAGFSHPSLGSAKMKMISTPHLHPRSCVPVNLWFPQLPATFRARHEGGWQFVTWGDTGKSISQGFVTVPNSLGNVISPPLKTKPKPWVVAALWCLQSTASLWGFYYQVFPDPVFLHELFTSMGETQLCSFFLHP